LQASMDATGTVLFYMWGDSDPVDNNGENAYPDLYGKAYNLNTQMWTAKKTFTSSSTFWWFYASNVALLNGTTYTVPCTNSVDRAGTGITLGTFDHYYYGDATFGQNEFVVGVQEQETGFGSVSLFPNPANDVVNLNVNMNQAGPVTVTLFNELGQSVLADKRNLSAGANRVQLNTSTLQAGVYFLSVADANGTTTSKVVIQ
ncbi:MAG TPA: T9SS type A sorting domain-containing protein, partial [Bacteroidia bacterium]|nr:T9SS type A sorting domain-containing protein [Bacteroidia bacterium]